MKKGNTKRPPRRRTASLPATEEKYSMLLAYDVPCYGSVEFTSKSDASALRKAKRMLADWDNRLADVSFMEEQEGADLYRIVSLIHLPTKRTVAEDLYMAPQPCPKVMIHVCGGVAEYYVQGVVEVALIDTDNIDAGDPPVELDESWRELAQGLFLQECANYVRFVKRK